MPQWIHDRALHILSKNPDMEEGLAFALATQQSHALGKSPRGYGTTEGRLEAKKKYEDPKAMKKSAFVESLPTLAGLSVGYNPGRSVAGETAAALAPQGRIHRSENMARNAAVIGAPLGGLVAMGLARKYHLAGKLQNLVGHKFPQGLIAEPEIEQELVHLGVPGVSAITGSLAGGGLVGGLVGGVQALRGPTHRKEAEAVKMGHVLRILTKLSTARAQAGEKEDAEFGDEDEAEQLAKAADDGGQGGFAVNEYSGVMNPPRMVYKSGIPPWTEPPVKKEASEVSQVEREASSFDPGRYAKPVFGVVDDMRPMLINKWKAHQNRDKTAMGTTPLGQLSSSKSVGAPKTTAPPGPSIAQISKPKGFGTPMSGAKKGNNTI